ncbi:MAG: exodeoxyribonuclease III [Nanobdellota archaeon]
MKIFSWNVNGIRAIARKGFADILKTEAPDVLCLQETKIRKEQLKEELTHIGDYTSYFSEAEKKGYSGVAIYTRHEPVAVIDGIGEEKFDSEGRVLTIELENFFVISVYVPNSQPELRRFDFRKEFNEKFQTFVKDLEAQKPVIICGDFNVAHNEIDLKNPQNNKMNPGFYIGEREKFTELLETGFVDTFRKLYPDTIKYSWWSYRFNARAKKIGWRIDYVLTSQSLFKHVKDAFIRNDIYGSDHCPVGILLGDMK